jgi:hypothetical protein
MKINRFQVVFALRVYRASGLEYDEFVMESLSSLIETYLTKKHVSLDLKFIMHILER